MIGEQHITRDKSGADPFATENVAQEIIDATAREQLNEIRNLVNYALPSFKEILTERKRRIDAKKQSNTRRTCKKTKTGRGDR